MRSRIQSYTLLATAVYVAYLAVTRQLDLYIHPRYIIFTITLSILCILVVLAASMSHRTKPDHSHNEFGLSTLPLLLLLVLALLFPARSLTRATVTQRSIDTNAPPSSIDIENVSMGSSKALSIQDWSVLIESGKSASFFNNKPAKISGFIYDAGLGDSTIWIARFILTCCAVDARPIGVPVYIPNWRSSFSENQWLEIEGMFRYQETLQGLILVPDSVTGIQEPDNPYAN